jgi:rare lipoprotein A
MNVKHPFLLSLYYVLMGLFLFSNVAGQQIDTSAAQEGGASYYGQEFHGRRTASGDIFDNKDFTAAHKTMPFNTYVNVVNLKNGKNVIVRINDRGPFVRNRIIDLSRSAAIRIESHLAGVVPVSVRVLNILKYSPELDSTYSASRIVKLNGVPEIELIPGSKSTADSLEQTFISFWSTTDLVHALYFAADLYLKSNDQQFFIGHELLKGRKRFHVLMKGTGRREGDKRIMTQLREEGFLECSVF